MQRKNKLQMLPQTLGTALRRAISNALTFADELRYKSEMLFSYFMSLFFHFFNFVPTKKALIISLEEDN